MLPKKKTIDSYCRSMTLEILNIEEGPKLATSLTMAVETKMSIKLFVDDGCNKGE